MELDFTRRAKRAKKIAEAKSQFERNQERVALIFNSDPFQCTVAALIFAVRPPRAPLVRFLPV
jgi:hypothetical protein